MRVLIANRGEIACRVIRACRALGFDSISVYSEADARSMHVGMADEAVLIGPAPARQSYLDHSAVLAAAAATRADAVHPGYGFLSENAAFARAVQEAGLIFIGPDPEIIETMGDKGRARTMAERAGVPVLPGSPQFGIDDGVGLDAYADATGFPLLVKAAGGGGGIGMRRVDRLDQLRPVVSAAQAQALRVFGNGSVYLERLVARARHIEIQVFGFGNGRVVTFPERDCSVQRRYQKVIEESPAPLLSDETRNEMRTAAGRLAASVNYCGAGTVEFIVDADSEQFYFLEMNTRIQVEHAVTEMVTGVDLVALQLQQAAGGDLGSVLITPPSARGHALEVRLYAESPERGFLPSPGHLKNVRLPAPQSDLRIDTGVRSGDDITPHYDPMIAKIVAWGPDRAAALDRLRSALAETSIEGVQTNLTFLAAVTVHAAFRRGGVTTDYIEANRGDLFAANDRAAAPV
ncbi:MAG: biotin carboxylase N-terminal domain-containing protein [Pseudolabrys sp.]|jgi:acetyl/propionyl-CoA carboxylase alpha subunit